MKTRILLLSLILSSTLPAQVFYSGTVGNESITMVIESGYPDNGLLAVYYLGENQHFAFWLSGYMENSHLKFAEWQGENLLSEVMLFNYDADNKELSGEMTFMGSGETFALRLNKSGQLDGEGFEVEDLRLDQLSGTEAQRFALLISKDEEEYYATTTGLLIMNDRFEVLQEFDGLEGMAIRGFESVEIDDFNFDGYLDVYVFGSQYAGANTSGYYFLFNTESQEFDYNSDLSSLISAYFDWSTQTVIETNQSGSEILQRFYAYDQNGQLLELNMTAEEYEQQGDTWNLTKTQEGDFETQVDHGKVIFFYNETIRVMLGQSDFTYSLRYADDRAILTNVKLPDDVLTYTIEIDQPEKQIWTRLENDNFETWILLK